MPCKTSSIIYNDQREFSQKKGNSQKPSPPADIAFDKRFRFQAEKQGGGLATLEVPAIFKQFLNNMYKALPDLPIRGDHSAI